MARRLMRHVRERVTTCFEIARAFAINPGDSLRALSVLPATVEALRRARRWDGTLPSVVDHPAQATEAGHALEHFFDSRRHGRGIWKWRHYFTVYERHLHKFVGQSAHIAEVGVYAGGSLEMWRHYFGPGSQIHGIDIDAECRAFQGEGIEIHVGDQADREFWAAFRSRVPALDAIIDDGSHDPRNQIVTFEETFAHLRPGGVYVCEDVAGEFNLFAAYMFGIVNELNAFVETGPLTTAAQGIQRWARSVHFYPYVTVVEKMEHPVDRFQSARRGTEWHPVPEGAGPS